MTATVAAVTQAQSLAAIRNFIRASISCITYARGLCSDDSFEQRAFLGLQLKHIIPNSTEATTISRWIEKGAFDALNRNYLKEMALCVYNGDCSEMLESYCFGFTYSEDGQRARMTLVSSQQALPITATNIETSQQQQCAGEPQQLPLSTLRTRRCSKQEVQQVLAGIIAKLVEVVESLPPLLRERVLTMRLTYYDEVTPKDYEPPYFAPASGRMVRFYLEEQKYNVSIGSMDTNYHIFSVSIRHPLLSKVHTKSLRHRDEAEQTFPNDTSGTAANSWLNEPTTGLSNPSLVRSNPFGKVDGSNHTEDKSPPACESDANDLTDRCRATATLQRIDVNTFIPLAQLLSKSPPLRVSEVAYLVVVTFIFMRASSSSGGRGRLLFSELKDYLCEACPLDIEPAAALAVIRKLLVEGYLQERVKERVVNTDGKASQMKPRGSGAADFGRSSGDGGAATGSRAIAPKSQKSTHLRATPSKMLNENVAEVVAEDTQWELREECPSPTILNGLLRQPQVIEMLSAAERETLQRLSRATGTHHGRAKRRRPRTTRALSSVCNYSELLGL